MTFVDVAGGVRPGAGHRPFGVRGPLATIPRTSAGPAVPVAGCGRGGAETRGEIPHDWRERPRCSGGFDGGNEQGVVSGGARAESAKTARASKSSRGVACSKSTCRSVLRQRPQKPQKRQPCAWASEWDSCREPFPRTVLRGRRTACSAFVGAWRFCCFCGFCQKSMSPINFPPAVSWRFLRVLAVFVTGGTAPPSHPRRQRLCAERSWVARLRCLRCLSQLVAPHGVATRHLPAGFAAHGGVCGARVARKKGKAPPDHGQWPRPHLENVRQNYCLAVGILLLDSLRMEFGHYLLL